MNMLALGDNVVDCYLDQRMYYPGGNAVNVAVGCKRAGFERVEYLGVFGDDPEAEHLKWALRQEGVAYDRSRKVYAITGHPQVQLTPEGDREFVGGPKNTAQHIVRIHLMPGDTSYMRQFDICHTSCYSSIEPELATMRSACELSYDFSNLALKEAYLALVCPHLRFAFFSGSGLDDAQTAALVSTVHGYGVEIIGITQGSKGALFSRRGILYRQGIKPVQVVDTMGAGDSFIAGFLTRFLHGAVMEEALDFAADCAAQTCTTYGGFGYGKPFDTD
mgnify:CR=1 FL=1